MAEPNGSSGMGFILGITFAAVVAVIAILAMGGNLPWQGDTAEIRIDLPDGG